MGIQIWMLKKLDSMKSLTQALGCMDSAKMVIVIYLLLGDWVNAFCRKHITPSHDITVHRLFV